MKIRVLSDLHFEFHEDGGRAFVDTVDPSGCDALVLAGDVSNAAGIAFALGLLCARFVGVPVLYVVGNHEFYGSSWAEAHAEIRRVRAPNFTWLDHETATVDGQRFVGTPLWFRDSPTAPKYAMNDFRQIRGFEPRVYLEADRALNFLETELREGDVLVTHYLPSTACVHPKYRGSPLNAFFVHDVSDLLRRRGVRLAIHGHTHESIDVTVGPTRFVANPCGYVGHEVNESFDPSFTIEIP